MARLMIVDDEVAIRRSLEKFLSGLGHEVISVENGEDGLKAIKDHVVDLALVDLVMPKMDGIEFVTNLKKEQPEAVAIILTGYGTISSAVQAMRAGAYHYLTKPFELDDIASLVSNALEHKALKEENRELRRQLGDRYKFQNIVGASESMHSVYDMIERVSPTDSTVLVLGESGTGKELVAKAIHYSSLRKEKPLIVVNCAAIPEGLLESELFGHMKGSFTGAVANKVGRFDAANTGTIFLDEIGDMSLGLQVKILRVLQDQCFEPVGSTKSHKVDVRIIAATNQDLEKAVKEKKFREDLFYRLNVIPVYIPPLRERKEDIPVLAEHFLCKLRSSTGFEVEKFHPHVIEAFVNYDWPGNVRELENLVERLVVMRKKGEIMIDDLPVALRRREICISSANIATALVPEEGISFKKAVEDFEGALIKQAVEMAGGNKNKAANLLGLNRTTLVEKIKKIGLKV